MKNSNNGWPQLFIKSFIVGLRYLDVLHRGHVSESSIIFSSFLIDFLLFFLRFINFLVSFQVFLFKIYKNFTFSDALVESENNFFVLLFFKDLEISIWHNDYFMIVVILDY